MRLRDFSSPDLGFSTEVTFFFPVPVLQIITRLPNWPKMQAGGNGLSAISSHTVPVDDSSQSSRALKPCFREVLMQQLFQSRTVSEYSSPLEDQRCVLGHK